MSVNGTLVEDKMLIFKGECAHFSFNKCPIYNDDGASAKFSPNSHETDKSAGSIHSRSCVVNTIVLVTFHPLSKAKETFFIPVMKNIFTIFHGPSEKRKALYSVNCILVSIVNLYICFAQCVEQDKNWFL